MAKLKETAIQWITFPQMNGDMTFAIVLDSDEGFYCGGVQTLGSIDPGREFTFPN